MKSSYKTRGVDLFNSNHVLLSNEEDSISWLLTQSKAFSIKSCYETLNDGGLHSTFKTNIWKNAAPLKVKLFTWLALKDKILSCANLAKRDWSGPLYCEICGFHIESISIFFSIAPSLRLYGTFFYIMSISCYQILAYLKLLLWKITSNSILVQGAGTPSFMLYSEIFGYIVTMSFFVINVEILTQYFLISCH